MLVKPLHNLQVYMTASEGEKMQKKKENQYDTLLFRAELWGKNSIEEKLHASIFEENSHLI